MRILSLNPAATELLYAIGAGGSLVGRCDGCDYPAAALTVPSIGPAAEMTAERAAILEPDLVLLGPGQEAIASRLGTLRLSMLRCASVEECLGSIIALAKTVGNEVEADVLVHDLRTAFDPVRERTARFKRTRVYAETRHEPWGTSPLVNELITIAGGEPFPGPIATLPELVRFEPHAIIVSVAGEGDRFDPELLLARDGWGELPAVRGERVFTVDDALLHRPGPRLAQGVKLLAKLLHGVHVNGN